MNQVKAGAVLNYIIIGANAVIGLSYTPYMLRCLGQSEYGLYSLVASIIAYLTLLDLGFGPTVIRYAAKYITEGKQREQSALYGLFFRMYCVIGCLALIIGIVLYFNIDWLFDRTMTESELSQAKTMIILLIVNLAITFPMSIFSSIIGAYERFIFQKIVILARLILSTAVLIVVLYLGYKAVALVVVQTVFNIALLVSNYLYCRRKLKIEMLFEKFDWTFIKELLGFSIWVFVADLMFKFYYSTGQFVLGATVGTAQVAVFAVGVTLTQMYIMFSTGIGGVLLPRITAMVSKNCTDHEISDVFIRVGRLQFFIMGLVLGGFIVFGKSFITIWAGPEYHVTYGIALILFVSTLIPLIQNTGITILQARNQLRFRSVMLLIVSAAGVFLQWIFSRYYGALGCALAVGLANVVGQGFILNWYYYKKQHIEIPKFWIEIGKMSIVPIILTSASYFIYSQNHERNLLSMVLWAGAYSFLYIFLSWFFSLNSRERKMLCDPFNRFIKKNIYD